MSSAFGALLAPVGVLDGDVPTTPVRHVTACGGGGGGGGDGRRRLHRQ